MNADGSMQYPSRPDLPKRKRVTFSLAAPEAGKVNLLLDMNRKGIHTSFMRRCHDGVWRKIKVLQPGIYAYKFVVDGKAMEDSDDRPINGDRDPFVNEVVVYLPTTLEI